VMKGRGLKIAVDDALRLENIGKCRCMHRYILEGD
jgi:hypothetical protein